MENLKVFTAFNSIAQRENNTERENNTILKKNSSGTGVNKTVKELLKEIGQVLWISDEIALTLNQIRGNLFPLKKNPT